MNRLLVSCLCVVVLIASITPLARGQASDTTAAPADKKINDLIGEAQSLQSRKRYLDAFSKLDEAEKLDPKRPEIYNIRGAIHLALQVRDIVKAREQFNKARELSPDSMPPLFNLAEVEFVSQKWDAAEKAFAAVLTKFPKLVTGVRHLITFKVLLCMVKQKQFAEADKFVSDNFTFMDDTPAYYFAKAIIALEKDDKRNGNDWLAKAQIIFKQQDNSAYLDSLMESHYIDSLAAGGDPP